MSSNKLTMLYEVPRNSIVKVEGIEQLIHFHHVDGMYSFCTIIPNDDTEKGTIHLAAWTPVEVVKKGD